MELKKSKFNAIGMAVGGIIMIMGVICIIIKALSAEYIDSSGILHENFFLIPIGILMIIAGLVVCATIGIINIVLLIKKKKR